jgi:hypothetical protein
MGRRAVAVRGGATRNGFDEKNPVRISTYSDTTRYANNAPTWTAAPQPPSAPPPGIVVRSTGDVAAGIPRRVDGTATC